MIIFQRLTCKVLELIALYEEYRRDYEELPRLLVEKFFEDNQSLYAF